MISPAAAEAIGAAALVGEAGVGVDGPLGDVFRTVVVLGLAVAMLLTLFRVLYGPSIPDRVIALDQLGFFAVGIIALWAMKTGQPTILSVAIVMALVLFLGTAAFALYLERRARP